MPERSHSSYCQVLSSMNVMLLSVVVPLVSCIWIDRACTPSMVVAVRREGLSDGVCVRGCSCGGYSHGT